jgi:hypothetical protein
MLCLLLSVSIVGCVKQNRQFLNSALNHSALPAPANELNRTASAQMTHADVHRLIAKYTAAWNSDSARTPLWVMGANNGDTIQIPGVRFGSLDQPKAGMELPVKAQLIVINQNMVPESILTTFFHEYGHACYRHENANSKGKIDAVSSEAEAIRFSLATLTSEGLDYLGYREAASIKNMAEQEPYKSAVTKLARDPNWRKFANGGDGK